MKQGLKFTPEQEQEFREMIKFHPQGFGEKMGVRADKIANTIWTFFVLLLFSIASYAFLQPILNQMLFISNTYQLIALPVLGIATGLSMMIILRFLFRILLEIRTEFALQKKALKILSESHDQLTELVTSIHVKVKAGEVDVETVTEKVE